MGLIHICVLSRWRTSGDCACPADLRPPPGMCPNPCPVFAEGWFESIYFQIVVLEKTLESPLNFKEIKPVNPKENQPWTLIARTDAETPIFWSPGAKSWLIGKDPVAGKDWRQEEKGLTEDEMVGWYHRPDGHEFEQALGDSEGQGSLECCSPWSRRVGTWLSDWTTNLQRLWHAMFLAWWSELYFLFPPKEPDNLDKQKVYSQHSGGRGIRGEKRYTFSWLENGHRQELVGHNQETQSTLQTLSLVPAVRIPRCANSPQEINHPVVRIKHSLPIPPRAQERNLRMPPHTRDQKLCYHLWRHHQLTSMPVCMPLACLCFPVSEMGPQRTCRLVGKTGGEQNEECTEERYGNM